MQIQLVVFDLSATVRDNDAVNACLQRALEMHGTSFDRDEINETAGLPQPLAIRQLLAQVRGSAPGPAEVRLIHHDFARLMRDCLLDGSEIGEAPDATAVFGELKARGVKVALTSSLSRVVMNTALERFGWTNPSLVEVTVASDEVARPRPHPDLVHRAMELAAVTEPARVATVGDLPSVLQEGEAAGCGLIIGVLGGSCARAQLERFPHTHLIDRLRDLPGAVAGSASPA